MKLVVKNKNCIHEETESTIKVGSVYSHLAEILMSFRSLSKNSKIKIYKTIITPLALSYYVKDID
jgi:hypothetical protein